MKYYHVKNGGRYKSCLVGGSYLPAQPRPIILTNQTFLFRETAGGASGIKSGRAWIDEIRGSTVKWNQLAQNGNFANGTTYWETYGSQYNTISASDGVLTSVNAASGTAALLQATLLAVVGHKYFISFGHKLVDGTTPTMISRFGTDYFTIVPSSSWETAAKIITANSTGNFELSFNYDTAVESTVSLRDIMVIDLTEMFGAGNEPSTVAIFESLYGKDYKAYNPGELVSFVGDKLVSFGTGFRSECSLPTISRTYTGVDGQTHTVEGLLSAGTAHDVLRKDEWEKHIGVVDLGTLTWYRSQWGAGFRIYAFLSGQKGVASGDVANGLTAGYTCVSANDAYQQGVNRTFYLASEFIGYFDSSYEDAADFKTAMAGVLLYYELATPETIPFDTPLDLSYRAENGGTEQIEADTLTTPIDADIAYPKLISNI